jgi:hypothetical protein
MVPAGGEASYRSYRRTRSAATDQLTAVFELPVTLAVNCWVADAARVIVDGASESAACVSFGAGDSVESVIFVVNA